MLTATVTQTRTYARTELLRANLEVAVHRLLDDGDALVERVVRPCLERNLIRRLDFLGVDDEERCRARLCLSIDWDRHALLVHADGRVAINEKWRNRVAPEVRVLLERFEETAARLGLTVRGRLILRPEVDREKACRILQVRPSRPIPWASEPARTQYAIKGLSELDIAYELAS